MDLSLISIDEMVKEIEKRCTTFICGYELPDDKETSWYYLGKGRWRNAVHLASILHNDCLNNWNGELKTLQRINEEREDKNGE